MIEKILKLEKLNEDDDILFVRKNSNVGPRMVIFGKYSKIVNEKDQSLIKIVDSYNLNQIKIVDPYITSKYLNQVVEAYNYPMNKSSNFSLDKFPKLIDIYLIK